MGKFKKITVGFKYYMDLHMLAGRGPMDELCEIKVGDRTAWKGSVKGNSSFFISQPSLFGGTKGEGGIEGQFDVMMGGPGQVKSAGLAKLLQGKQPEFRGIVSFFFSGMVTAMNSYPKPWKFLLRRCTSGWDGGTWYPEKARIILKGYYDDGTTRDIHAMNPAHIIYECLTNRSWGLGRNRSLFLDDSWRKAADTLYEEGFGLCIRWGRQDTLLSFVQTVIDHIGCTVYVDKFTGKFKIKLIRNDYDADSLPVFDTDSGLVAINEATNASPFNLLNEIIVVGQNPVTDKEIQMRQHNLALIQTQGAINSETRDYPGLPTPQLCLVVAERDLKAASTNIRRFTIVCDRRAWRIQPGDVIKIRDPQSRGIETVILRVGKVTEASQIDGQITITALQDSFGVDLNTFGEVQPPTHIEPDFEPQLARRLIYEATYAELARLVTDGEFNAIRPNEGYIHAHAERPTPVSMGFDLAIRPPGAADFVVDGGGDFTPIGQLAGQIGYLDTSLTYEKEIDFDDEEDVYPGAALVIVDSTRKVMEFVRLEAIDTVNKIMTIARGVMDTIPQRHFGGAEIWVTQDNGGSDYVKYISGSEVELKVVPYTMRGKRFDIDQVPIDELRFRHRFFRPYAPGLVTWTTLATGQKRWYELQDLRYDATEAEVPDFITINWAHRDRPLQDDQLIDHMQGDIGPEPGTTYRLRFFNATGQLVRTETGIIGTQYVYSYAQASIDTQVEAGAPEATSGTIYLDTMRDGVESWMYYTLSFTIHKKPPQYAEVSGLAMQTTADDTEIGTGDDSSENANVAMMSMSTAQEDTEVQDDSSANAGGQVAMMAAPVTQSTKLLPLVDFYLYETPYLTLAREGRDLSASQLMAFTARPSDRLTDGFDLFDRKEGEADWQAQGAQPWTPWGILKGFMHFLTNEFEIGDSSDTDGVPTQNVQTGDIVLIGNELMNIVSVNGKRFKVGRGTVDTVPAVHYAGSVVWLFDRSHASSNRLYDPDDKAQAVVRPHSYALTISPDDMPYKQLQLQGRPTRPYPPGLLLANGMPWYERVNAYPTAMDYTKPEGKDVALSWAHRNRIWQDDRAYDHFATGITPERDVQYRIWVGYTVSDGKTSTEVTLGLFYTADNGLTLRKDDIERWGKQAGLALKSYGIVAVQMAVNAVRDGEYNWQGYGLTLVLPSLPLPPGEQPGGGGIPNPNYPDPGSPTPNPNDPGGQTPGEGGGTDPKPDPNDPDPNPDPDVPDTDPPDPEPEPEPDPDNVYGWSLQWDHGWAAQLPNQSGG